MENSRSTFATIKDLAARGVSFDGGTITLTQDDLKGSFNVLQAQLLDAAKSNIVFDTENVSSWSLGKAMMVHLSAIQKLMQQMLHI